MHTTCSSFLDSGWHGFSVQHTVNDQGNPGSDVGIHLHHGRFPARSHADQIVPCSKSSGRQWYSWFSGSTVVGCGNKPRTPSCRGIDQRAITVGGGSLWNPVVARGSWSLFGCQVFQVTGKVSDELTSYSHHPGGRGGGDV